MDYVRLGKTGLEVSRICLGCMSFGDPKLGREWTMPLEPARPIIRAAWEAGINFFDTANVYAAGTSEEITGTVLKELAPRDELVIATKVNGEMRKGPNGRVSRARPSSARSTIRCAGSRPTMSTSTRSTASITTRRSRKPSKRCTTS